MGTNNMTCVVLYDLLTQITSSLYHSSCNDYIFNNTQPASVCIEIK